MGSEKDNEESQLDKFIGKTMKVVVQEPTDDRPKAFEATIAGIEKNMLIIDTDSGVGAYKIDYVIAIKPIIEKNR